MNDLGLEKVASWVMVGCVLPFTFAALIQLQPTKESTQVISNPSISYSKSYFNNSYCIKNKTKIYKVAAKNFFKKSTSNKNLNKKMRLTITKGTIVPVVFDFTVTQYVYHK